MGLLKSTACSARRANKLRNVDLSQRLSSLRRWGAFDGCPTVRTSHRGPHRHCHRSPDTHTDLFRSSGRRMPTRAPPYRPPSQCWGSGPSRQASGCPRRRFGWLVRWRSRVLAGSPFSPTMKSTGCPALPFTASLRVERREVWSAVAPPVMTEDDGLGAPNGDATEIRWGRWAPRSRMDLSGYP